MLQRSLKQLCRENLIMQASNWQFLISTWSARDYAEQRMGKLYNCIERLIQYVNNLANGVNLSLKNMPIWRNWNKRIIYSPIGINSMGQEQLERKKYENLIFFISSQRIFNQ